MDWSYCNPEVRPAATRWIAVEIISRAVLSAFVHERAAQTRRIVYLIAKFFQNGLPEPEIMSLIFCKSCNALSSSWDCWSSKRIQIVLTTIAGPEAAGELMPVPLASAWWSRTLHPEDPCYGAHSYAFSHLPLPRLSWRTLASQLF